MRGIAGGAHAGCEPIAMKDALMLVLALLPTLVVIAAVMVILF
ncbi:MAG: hypothetical protein R3357_04310 [Burkholderiales bacterium]|nr:hypothetical protein [Burkholderiales bacterium]